jgi:hypothetical protein
VETLTLTNDLLAFYAYTLNSIGQCTRMEEGVVAPTVRTVESTYDDAVCRKRSGMSKLI